MREAIRRPLLPEAEAEDPRDHREARLFRWSLAGAAAFHAILLPLPVPTSAVRAAVEPPARAIFEIVNRRPQPPEPPTPVEPPDRPREPAVSIPVPAIDDPQPLPDDQPLPLPDPAAADVDPGLFATVLDGPPPAPAPEPGPVYVSGDIEPPEAIQAPRPRYPEIAQRTGRDGLVVLQAVIDREGRVRELRVLRGAPFGMTEAALEAVRGWRFRPARRDGEPVAVYYQLTVRFHQVR